MIEVLKQLVDALETYGNKHRKTYLLEGAWDEEITKGDAAIEAGKQAIAELESQEPIGYAVSTFDFDNSIIYKVHYEHTVPLYTHPPQRTEPPAWFPAVENILNEYGLQAIDFVADFKAAMKDAEQSQRTEERNFCSRCGKRLGKRLDGIDSIHTCTPPMEQNT